MKINRLIINILVLMFIFTLTFSYPTSFGANEPEISAGAAILMDSSNEKILYSKNEEQKMYPASTTKILTAIIAIEKCDLNDVVTVPYEAVAHIPSGYSIASLQVGEQLTLEQLLNLMMVHSANDAANVIAFHISGSLEDFAVLMNEKVQELNLKNTHFLNPSGMHNDDHYTTAHDLALIMKYCMKNQTFRKIAGLKYCIVPATNKYEERVFNTTNELLIYSNSNVKSNYYYQYAIAGKTGYTTQAKNCLVSVSNKDNLELICVVLSTGLYADNLSAKFIDTKTLFDYGYDNYTIKKLREQGAIATQIDISNGNKETKNLDLLLSDDITAVVKKEELNTEFEPSIQINENLYAPIKQNEKVGKITYTIDNIEYTSDLIASHSVEKSSFMSLTIQISLIILIIFVIYKLLFDDNFKKKRITK